METIIPDAQEMLMSTLCIYVNNYSSSVFSETHDDYFYLVLQAKFINFRVLKVLKLTTICFILKHYSQMCVNVTEFGE